MKNNKVWIIFGLMLLGLSLGLRMVPDSSGRKSNNGFSDIINQPMNIKSSSFELPTQDIKVDLPKPRRAGVVPKAISLLGEDGKIKPAKLKIADKKKKPKKTAKKKKEKKKTEGKDFVTNGEQNPAQENSQAAQDPKEKSETSAEGTQSNNLPAGAIQNGTGPQQEVIEKLSLQDWQRKVFNGANFRKAVLELIHHKQSGLLADETWFYTIVQQLLDSNKPRHREYGVYALGSVPSSQSFEYLVEVSEERYDRKASEDADQYLRQYASNESMWGVLLQALSGQKERSRIRAARLVREAALIQSTIPIEDRAQGGRTSKRGNSSLAVFSFFAPALESMLENATSEEERTVAQQTLDYLHGL